MFCEKQICSLETWEKLISSWKLNSKLYCTVWWPTLFRKTLYLVPLRVTVKAIFPIVPALQVCNFVTQIVPILQNTIPDLASFIHRVPEEHCGRRKTTLLIEHPPAFSFARATLTVQIAGTMWTVAALYPFTNLPAWSGTFLICVAHICYGVR